MTATRNRLERKVTQMYVIVNHYSNAEIHVFDRIDVRPAAYTTLEGAKKAVEASIEGMKDVHASWIDAKPYEVTAKDCEIAFDGAACVMGCACDEQYKAYHDVYAIYEANVSE